MSEMVVIEFRTKKVINTDPQRRCYNGAHAESKVVWGAWGVLEYVREERSEERLKFWKELNDYAVTARGEESRSEFRIISFDALNLEPRTV